MYKGVGMSSFYNMHVNTYPVLVLEILSSLSIEWPKRDHPTRRVGFRLFNIERSMTLVNFGDYFGHDDSEDIPLSNYNPNHLWRDLTNGTLKSYQHLHAHKIN